RRHALASVRAPSPTGWRARAMNAARALGRCAVTLGVALLLGGATPPPSKPSSGCPCPAKPVLRVAFHAMESGGGWALSFLTPPCPPLVEIRVAIDGGKPISLGHENEKDPLTHRPAAQHMLVLDPERLA